MNDKQFYTTQLAAGSAVIDETRMLLDLWQPGMKTADLLQTALDSGTITNVTARRLRNLIMECYAPRYLVNKDFPAIVLKQLVHSIPSNAFNQILFLFTARANLILSDFVKMVYWPKYSAGHDTLSNDDANNFITRANQEGKTVKQWSENTISRNAGYLTSCCADFGLLETGRKQKRQIKPFRIEKMVILFLLYDLHLSGLGDNSVISHPDWELFGIEKEDLREEMKRLSLKGFFMIQSAGDVTRIEWKYESWEELINVIPEC